MAMSVAMFPAAWMYHSGARGKHMGSMVLSQKPQTGRHWNMKSSNCNIPHIVMIASKISRIFARSREERFVNRVAGNRSSRPPGMRDIKDGNVECLSKGISGGRKRAW